MMIIFTLKFFFGSTIKSLVTLTSGRLFHKKSPAFDETQSFFFIELGNTVHILACTFLLIEANHLALSSTFKLAQVNS